MRTIISLVTIVLLPTIAFADQTDSRLDNLFTQLLLSDDLRTIRVTENQIWEIWLEHPNSDVERLMAIGTQRMNSRQFPEALLAFNQITENFPDYAEGWNKRATLYYLVGNFDASLADIEKTLALEPRHFGALSGQGLVYIQRNELSKAKAVFETLIEIHPNSPNAQENLETVTENLRFNLI